MGTGIHPTAIDKEIDDRKTFFPQMSAWGKMCLGLILAVYVVIRVPVAYLQPTGQDEDYYAVPGLTILEDGIPRLPHVRPHDETSFFYRADEVLFAEPPLYFYWQALFYAALPDTTGTARLSSIVPGGLAIVLVFLLARRWLRMESAALWAAAIYSLSRMFYFPASTARPDMLCGLFGLAAVLTFARWVETNCRRWFIASGLLIGLGGLTHPFALAYACQIGGWAGLEARGIRRLLHPAGLALLALAVCTLWLPLIVNYPEHFRIQFGNNIFNVAGPGVFQRQVLPWSSLAHHAGLMWDHCEPIQFALFTFSVLGTIALVVFSRRDDKGLRTLAGITVSSIWLICTVAGLHPTKGYWCYPAAFISICAAFLISVLWQSIWLSHRSKPIAAVAGGLMLLGMMLPGLGLRAWWVYVSHHNDINYNAPRFARQLMMDWPAGAKYRVDVQYAVEFYAAGRDVEMAHSIYISPQVQMSDYDYLIISRSGDQENIAEQLNGKLIRRYGIKEDPFACYAEVYVPQNSGP